MRDTTRQIGRSKLSRPIYDERTKLKCPVDRLNLLCCDAASGSLFCHQASGRVNSSSAARALCGIGIAPYVATFLVSIFHLPRSYSYLANLEKSSPIHTWSSGRLRWRELEDLYKRGSVTWMEMIPDQRFSIWFPNNVHRSSRNKYAECRINSIFCAQSCQSKGSALYGVWGNLWISRFIV